MRLGTSVDRHGLIGNANRAQDRGSKRLMDRDAHLIRAGVGVDAPLRAGTGGPGSLHTFPLGRRRVEGQDTFVQQFSIDHRRPRFRSGIGREARFPPDCTPSGQVDADPDHEQSPEKDDRNGGKGRAPLSHAHCAAGSTPQWRVP